MSLVLIIWEKEFFRVYVELKLLKPFICHI